MTLIKQVLADLWKELGWILLYGTLTAMSIMTFILIALSYQQVAGQSASISRFVENHVYTAQIKGMALPTSGASQPSDLGGSGSMAALEAYLGSGFSGSGKLGTCVSLPYRRGEYDNLILCLGKYADLTRFDRPNDRSTVIATSPDLREMVGTTIQIGSKEFPIQTAVPDSMDLYHPLYYVPAGSETLKRTLYIFTEDYPLIKGIFPQLAAEHLLDRLIVVAPTEHDLTELRAKVYKATGLYTGIRSVESTLAAAEANGTRTHQTYLLFYISASAALLGAMLLNMARAFSGMMPSYTTHHLFGAPKKLIFFRMLLFAIGYNAIPILGALFMMLLNRLLSLKNILLLLSAVLGTALFMSAVMYQRFKTNISQGLRRE